MAALIRLVLLAAAFAAGTWVFGWWSVPAIAGIWGLIARGATGSAINAGIGTSIAWGALLALDALGGRLGVLLSRIAPLFFLPSFALVLVAIVFAAVLAWSSAATTGALAGQRSRP